MQVIIRLLQDKQMADGDDASWGLPDYRTPEPSKPGPYLLKGLKRVSVSNSPIADANAGECRLNYRAGPAVQAVQV